MSTFDPEFTSHYFSDTAPGDNWDKLRDEMKRTVDHYEYTNFRILKVGRASESFSASNETVMAFRAWCLVCLFLFCLVFPKNAFPLPPC
jgi:hypothetical protein